MEFHTDHARTRLKARTKFRLEDFPYIFGLKSAVKQRGHEIGDVRVVVESAGGRDVDHILSLHRRHIFQLVFIEVESESNVFGSGDIGNVFDLINDRLDIRLVVVEKGVQRVDAHDATALGDRGPVLKGLFSFEI